MNKKNRIILCVILSSFLILSSCTRFAISREVKRFVGTTVTYPAELQYVKGTNPYYQISEDPCATLVFWYDDKECSTCRLSNLGEMRKIFDFCRDSVSCINIKIVFTPSFEKKELFMEFLNNSEREFPIYIDVNNKFGTANENIPERPQYHVFLLDKDNKVLLIGNPLLTQQMWNLYRNTLFSVAYIK